MASASAAPARPQTKRSLLASATLRRLQHRRQPDQPKQTQDKRHSARSLPFESSSSTILSSIPSSTSSPPTFSLVPPAETQHSSSPTNDKLSDKRDRSLLAIPRSGQSAVTSVSQQSQNEATQATCIPEPSTGRDTPVPRNAIEMRRLLNRSTNANGRNADSPKEAGARRDLRRFAKSTADLVDSDRDNDGYFSAHESRGASRKSETYGRKSIGQYSTSRDGYLSSGAEDKPSGGLRSISRKFFKPASQTTNQGSSPYSWFASSANRQGSYSSESTLQSSPPHTPTTPHSSVEISSATAKDSILLNGLPQLPPLSSLGGNASKDEASPLSAMPSSMGLATSIHTSHLASSTAHSHLAPKTALSITVPTPARTSSVVLDSSPRVTIAPLPHSPSTPYSPVVSSPLASRPGPPSSSSSAARTSPKKESARPASSLPSSSAFDESSDFLAAVLNFSESGVGSTLFDDTPASSRPSAQPSSFNTTSSSFASFSYQSPLSSSHDSPRGLPRRLTEAQLAEIEQQERQKKTAPSRFTYGRSTAQTPFNARPGLFASSHRKAHDSESEDEYGEADPAELDDDEDWEAAKKSEPGTPTESSASNKKTKKNGDLTIQTQGLSKPVSGRKSSDLMSKASAFLKPRSSASPLSPSQSPPSTSAGDGEDGNRPPTSYPSSFSRSKKSPAPSPKPSQDGMSWAPQATPLPGLNSPAKRALYACTLLKVHPQLDSILKVGVSSAVEFGEIAGSVEIRFPRSINTAKKLDAANKFGGSQLGVAGAPITLGSRRLDVALAQTKVMRKLRRRLTRQDEVEIGWFLKGYASEIISPETIAKSLAAKPQVSPEALAKPLMSAQEGEKRPLQEATSEGRASIDSVSPVSPSETAKIAMRRATIAANEPNGLVKWVMRKPFLERCAMIRGETEPTFNVGDVVVDAEQATTAILPVSADTFDGPDQRRDSLHLGSAAGTAARPGDLILSPKIRILAGMAAKPETNLPPMIAKREQPSKALKKAPPPWVAHRQPSGSDASPTAAQKAQAAHLQAAHDKLVGKAQQPITRAPAESPKFLSPAQALAAEARASLQLHRGSASPATGNSPMHSPSVSNGGFDGGETDSNEASGGEYYSAVETDDDDLPISTLALRRRPSAISIGEREEASDARDIASVTVKEGASPDSRRTMSPLVEEQQRIAALEQELSALKKREQYRESLLYVERARLAKIKADQEAARQLEDHKRQLRQARERRAKTDHSEVLTSQTYGAGDSLAWYEQSSTSRRIRQSSSMADLPTPQLGAAFVSQSSQVGLSAPRSSSQNTRVASPLLGTNAAMTPTLGSVPEGHSMSPNRNGHSPPGRAAERVGKRQSSLPVPPVAASARASAALGRALSPQPTHTGQFPNSPSQQDMRDVGARRLSSGSSAGQHVGLPRVSSRSNMRSPSPGPDVRAPNGLSPHSFSPQPKRLSTRPSLSALQATPAQAMSPRMDMQRATSPTPGGGLSMYNMPRGMMSENNLSPGSSASHSGHVSAEQSQQQQWQLFQQWQQMQYMQQQQLQRAQSHSQVHGLMANGMPHSASFGGMMGGPQPLVHLGVGDVPSSAVSARYREV